MLRWFEHHQVYQPNAEFVAGPGAVGHPFEEVCFRSEDGIDLHGWFFPGRAAGSPPRHIVLFHHGNAGNISHRVAYYRLWLDIGLGVFTFDYRGYGRSSGRPDEAGTYRDAQAAYRWLRSRGHPAQSIVAIGKSLGGGVAAELAMRELLAALVLHNTFTSVPDLGAELFPFLPVRRLARIRYHTEAKLPKLNLPVLIAHSPGDRLIRFAHGERNFAAARQPKSFLRLAGEHNSSLEGEGLQIYRQGLERFLGGTVGR